MAEGKVNWNYTCPICKKVFPYNMFAGVSVRVCDKCKEFQKKMSEVDWSRLEEVP